MEKIKQRFKVSCYILLGYVGVAIIELIIPFIRGIDAQIMYPDIEANLVNYVIGIAVALSILSIVLHLLLVVLGFKAIKKNSTGWGHMVLEFVLAIVAFSNLYSAIANFSGAKDMFGAVLSLIVAIIWVASLLIYDWFAIHFRSALLNEKNKTES